MYQKVYEAERPENFLRNPWARTFRATHVPIRIRKDSHWNVPEPELVLVINSHKEVVGYCAGNDVSSRDIEGENPLYLPQAKIYNGSCALGHGILICEPDAIQELSDPTGNSAGRHNDFRGRGRHVLLEADAA